MSRKRTQPKKIPVLDPKFKSAVIPKLINFGIIVDLYLESTKRIFCVALFFLDII